jgi:hypothetical protein
VKRKEFLRLWKVHREQALRDGYRDDPHGAACLAMSLGDVEKEGLALWRKYRAALSSATPEQVFKVLDSPAAEVRQ